MDEKKKNNPLIPDPLEILDNFASAVEMFTGFKNMFIQQGWDPINAEAMVIEILKAGNIQTGKENS